MLQVCKICPRCLTMASVFAFPDNHKAAISPVTFGLNSEWAITWCRTGAPVFHSVKTPCRLYLSLSICFHLADCQAIMKSVFLQSQLRYQSLAAKGQLFGYLMRSTWACTDVGCVIMGCVMEGRYLTTQSCRVTGVINWE